MVVVCVNVDVSEDKAMSAELPTVGDTVTILPQGNIDYPRKGVVRFAGTTEFAEGQWVGVELNPQWQGKNSGTVAGVDYFKCLDGQGAFIRPELVVQVDGAESVNVPVASGGAAAVEAMQKTLVERGETIATLTAELDDVKLDLELAVEEHLMAKDEVQRLETQLSFAGGGGASTAAADAVEELRLKVRNLKQTVEQHEGTIAELKEQLAAEAACGGGGDDGGLLEAMTESKLELEEDVAALKVECAQLKANLADMESIVTLQEEEINAHKDIADEASEAATGKVAVLKEEHGAAVQLVTKLRSRIAVLEDAVQEAEVQAAAQDEQRAASDNRTLQVAHSVHQDEVRAEAREELAATRQQALVGLVRDAGKLVPQATFTAGLAELEHLSGLQAAANACGATAASLRKPVAQRKEQAADGLLRHGAVVTDVAWNALLAMRHNARRAEMLHVATFFTECIAGQHSTGEKPNPCDATLTKAVNGLVDVCWAPDVSDCVAAFTRVFDQWVKERREGYFGTVGDATNLLAASACACTSSYNNAAGTLRYLALYAAHETDIDCAAITEHLDGVKTLAQKLGAFIETVRESRGEMSHVALTDDTMNRVLTLYVQLSTTASSLHDAVATLNESSADVQSGFVENFFNRAVTAALSSGVFVVDIAPSAKSHLTDAVYHRLDIATATAQNVQHVFEDSQQAYQGLWNAWSTAMATQPPRPSVIDRLSTRIRAQLAESSDAAVKLEEVQGECDQQRAFVKDVQGKLTATETRLVKMRVENESLGVCKDELKTAQDKIRRMELSQRESESAYESAFSATEGELKSVKAELKTAKQQQQRARFAECPALSNAERQQMERSVEFYRRQAFHLAGSDASLSDASRMLRAAGDRKQKWAGFNDALTTHMEAMQQRLPLTRVTVDW
jgi:predicted  nucleic acid-binding Zn-ribbon protein